MPATEPAPETASCSLRKSRWMSRGSSPWITASSERRIEVSPGAKKHSPNPLIPSSVSTLTKVQSKLPSTTAVFKRTIFMASSQQMQQFAVDDNVLLEMQRTELDCCRDASTSSGGLEGNLPLQFNACGG